MFLLLGGIFGRAEQVLSKCFLVFPGGESRAGFRVNHGLSMNVSSGKLRLKSRNLLRLTLSDFTMKYCHF